MPTLTGFTRPADPIWDEEICRKISTDIGKTITCLVNPTTIDVSGSTLVTGDRAAIQASINSYVYMGPNYGNIVTISNNPDMSGASPRKVISEQAAFGADTSILSSSKTYTDTKTWSVSQVTGLQAFLNDKVNISSLATVATTGDYADLINKPTAIPNLVSRSLNTIFQPSTTKTILAKYDIRIACTASLAGGQEGSVVMEKSLSSTFASGITQAGIIENKNSVSLAIALTAIQEVTLPLVGVIPANYYVRLRTINVSGTPTFTYKDGEETTLL